MAHRGRLRTTAALLAVVAALPAATGGDGTFEPELVTEHVYFTCTDGQRVGNASLDTVPWSQERPEDSVQEGAGCATADPDLVALSGTMPVNAYDAAFSGTFTGHLDRVTVRAWTVFAGPQRASGEFRLTPLVTLTIDGVELLPFRTAVPVRVEPTTTGAAALVEFTVTDLGFVWEEAGGTHDVLVALDTRGSQGAWTWGTREFPSGLVFNPDTPSPEVAAPVNRPDDAPPVEPRDDVLRLYNDRIGCDGYKPLVLAPTQESTCGRLLANANEPVYRATGQPQWDDRFVAADGLPFRLDATRPVRGVLGVSTYGRNPAAGLATFDFELYGTIAGSEVLLGSDTVSYLATAGPARYFPHYRIDPAPPYDGAVVDGVTLRIVVRGANGLHAYLMSGEATWLELPTGEL